MLCEKQYYTPKESIFCFGVLQKNEKLSRVVIMTMQESFNICYFIVNVITSCHTLFGFYISVTISFIVFPGGIIGSTFTSGLIRQSTTTVFFRSNACCKTGFISSFFVMRKPSMPNAPARATKSVALCGSVCEKRFS